jgi:hypothetical protein
MHDCSEHISIAHTINGILGACLPSRALVVWASFPGRMIIRSEQMGKPISCCQKKQNNF